VPCKTSVLCFIGFPTGSMAHFHLESNRSASSRKMSRCASSATLAATNNATLIEAIGWRPGSVIRVNRGRRAEKPGPERLLPINAPACGRCASAAVQLERPCDESTFTTTNWTSRHASTAGPASSQNGLRKADDGTPKGGRPACGPVAVSVARRCCTGSGGDPKPTRNRRLSAWPLVRSTKLAQAPILNRCEILSVDFHSSHNARTAPGNWHHRSYLQK